MKHRKEKSLRIGSAVIRGRKDRYEFEVFPLDVEMQPVPAVFVISRRVVDREGRGHHKFVCIGQTESLAHEIKIHKKGKCIKKFRANVVSVLPTESEKSRFSIEADLKAAHSTACLRETENAVRKTEPASGAQKADLPKAEKKSVETISPVVAKPARAKITKQQITKTEVKPEQKKEAPKPRIVKEKTASRVATKTAPNLKAKAAAQSKVSSVKEIGKIKTPKAAAVKSAKSKIRATEKFEPVKPSKSPALKTPALKTMEAAKNKTKVSKTNSAAAKTKTGTARKQMPVGKLKTVLVKQTGKAVVPKTAEASKAKKTASKDEIKTTKTARKAVAAAKKNQTNGERKK